MKVRALSATFDEDNQSKQMMRYWAILAAKLAGAAAILYVIWWGLTLWYRPPVHIVIWRQSAFLHDLNWTTAMFLYNLLAQGLLFWTVRDQRRRCRTCGRILRMPVSHGSYGQMLLFGRPRTEYICVYGHGTLTVPELHVSGREPSSWAPHTEDMWKELYALDRASKNEN